MITITIDGTDYSVPSNASDTNWASNQVAWEQAVSGYVDTLIDDVAELQPAITAPSWSDVTLANGWVQVSGEQAPQITKLPNGLVIFRAGVDSGIGSLVTLDAQYRPQAPFLATIVAGASQDGIANLRVGTDGVVTVIELSPSGGDPFAGSFFCLSWPTN